MQKLVDFVKTTTGLDKIHAKRTARDYEHYGDEYVDHGVDKAGEKARLEAEKIVGKTLYIIDKGGFPLDDFCNTLEDKEFIKHSDNLYELKFEDFSVYGDKAYYGWRMKYMDAKEVILPLKKDLVRGSRRLYILGVDGNLMYLPELEYPTTIAPFLKYLKKKKKLAYSSAPVIWNCDKKIADKSGELSLDFDWNRYRGYPVKNIKSLADLDEYNAWLFGPDMKKLLDDWNAKHKGSPYFIYHLPKSNLTPTEINITQADVDDFINTQNSRYQVKR